MGTLARNEDPDEFAKTKSLKKLLQYFFFRYQHVTPQYILWTIPSVLYKTRRKNLLVNKGLTQENSWQYE